MDIVFSTTIILQCSVMFPIALVYPFSLQMYLILYFFSRYHSFLFPLHSVVLLLPSFPQSTLLLTPIVSNKHLKATLVVAALH